MSGPGVHRLIERQVATAGDRIAISGVTDGLTYRELNQRANIVARRLMASGLRRASRVVVKMERSPELAVLLLAVLKGGAAYMWVNGNGDDDGRWPKGVSIIRGDREALIMFGPSTLLHLPLRSAPNLPIITRPEDLACVVPTRNGQPDILVPHATITALQSHPLPDRPVWSGDVTALDLWLPLMAGATVSVASSAAQIAAA
jgi:non-ribosomal peptide synthetase component F